MTPEIEMPPGLERSWEQHTSLEDFERRILSAGLDGVLPSSPGSHILQRQLESAWRSHDHAVLRGLPARGGITLLWASAVLSSRFRTYRVDRIVKNFRMSPWTRELSHTLAAGDFHTDLNTTPTPPAVTAIQCETPDPGAPRFGCLRVARASALLKELGLREVPDTVSFLSHCTVTMVDRSSSGSWSGRIMSHGSIRFHPETLRAAQRRLGQGPVDLEVHLARIKEAALAISEPIHLNPGDILFVSNRRALHYRDECSVRFHSFPSKFDARSVHVLHTSDEPFASQRPS